MLADRAGHSDQDTDKAVGVGGGILIRQALAKARKAAQIHDARYAEVEVADFSVTVSPSAPYIMIVPNGMARMIHAIKLLCISLALGLCAARG